MKSSTGKMLWNCLTFSCFFFVLWCFFRVSFSVFSCVFSLVFLLFLVFLFSFFWAIFSLFLLCLLVAQFWGCPIVVTVTEKGIQQSNMYRRYETSYDFPVLPCSSWISPRFVTDMITASPTRYMPPPQSCLDFPEDVFVEKVERAAEASLGPECRRKQSHVGSPAIHWFVKVKQLNIWFASVCRIHKLVGKINCLGGSG